MVHRHEKSDDGTYVEDFGRYYEEFTVGDVYEHRPGRTITQTDNVWFTLLSMNQNPLHFDEVHSADTEFGEPLVDSTLTLAIVTGMSVSDVSYKTVANLGWDEVRLPNPVFEGDTIYARSEVVSKRESESRDGEGIVTVETEGYNQDGETVITFERTLLIPFEDASDGTSEGASEGSSGEDRADG
ncbi:MAG: MaoC family dehydratase [Haloferacaceae archaeon]